MPRRIPAIPGIPAVPPVPAVPAMPCAAAKLHSVASIADDELLRRAVTNARSRRERRGGKQPRWVGVMDTFALGSTYARQLCRRFDLDPDEMVSR